MRQSYTLPCPVIDAINAHVVKPSTHKTEPFTGAAFAYSHIPNKLLKLDYFEIDNELFCVRS